MSYVKAKDLNLSSVKDLLVSFLVCCEKEGAVTINREWLARQRGRAAKPGVTA